MHRLSDLYKKFYHSFQNGRGVFCECLTLSNFWATELTWIIFLDAAAVVSNHTASSGGLTYFCAHRFVSPLHSVENLRIFPHSDFTWNQFQWFMIFKNCRVSSFRAFFKTLLSEIDLTEKFMKSHTVSLIHVCSVIDLIWYYSNAPRQLFQNILKPQRLSFNRY